MLENIFWQTCWKPTPNSQKEEKKTPSTSSSDPPTHT